MRDTTLNAFKAIRVYCGQIDDPVKLWYKCNWEIVHVSHYICRRRGVDGHSIRQRIRRSLWRTAKLCNPKLRKFYTEMELCGDTKPHIIGNSILDKIKSYFRGD